MASIINMPRLSPTMDEGVLAKWTKKEGDRINPGDIIAEVETDKANMDFPLEDEGTLLRLLAREGQTVKLGGPVAILGDPGEDITALLQQIGASPEPTQAKPAQAAQAQPAPAQPAQAQPAPAQPTGQGAAVEPGADLKAPLQSILATEEALSHVPATADDDSTDSTDDAAVFAQAQARKQARAQAQAQAHAEALARAQAQAAAQPGSSQPSQPAVPAAPGAQPREESAEKTGRTLASPLARRLADDAGIDLRSLQGSGPGGRVIKRDIERAVAEQSARRAAQPPAPAAPAQPAAQPLPPRPAASLPPAPPRAAADTASDELVPWSMMRRTIARRLTESKQTVPHFYLTAEAVVDDLLHFRENLNRTAAAQGTKVSVNDLVVKALARALRQVPKANASFTPDGLRVHGAVDIGVAVALEDGLITPVVRGAAEKSIGAIAAEVRDLAERGRNKRLRPEEYQGATFSVTNLGMFGIREFFAIINPPESGILAVGQVEARPAVITHDGADNVVVQRRMTLTLSCDHRVIDGALGARLLGQVVQALQQPLLLVL